MGRHHEMMVFQSVAEELSLAAAARRLHAPTPQVTRAINALEARLDIALLSRSTRGVRLTPAGERFLLDSQRILMAVNEAEESACGLHVKPQGHLSLATPLLLSQQLLTPILLDYLTTYPEVQIFHRHLDHSPNLHEEGIDVAIQVGLLPDSSLFALKVGTVRRVVCASPDYLAGHGEPRHPRELPHHHLIHSSADARIPEWHFQDQRQQHRISFLPRLTCTTNQAAIAAACRGAGLIRCMSYESHELLQQERLHQVLTTFEPPELPVHLVYREGRRAAAKVRSFVDFAAQRLREHAALR